MYKHIYIYNSLYIHICAYNVVRIQYVICMSGDRGVGVYGLGLGVRGLRFGVLQVGFYEGFVKLLGGFLGGSRFQR